MYILSEGNEGNKKKRWGKPFKDNRNWINYNEELVVRGEFLLELEWVKSWNDELKRMNDGKRGSPFIFPESLIRLQGLWHQLVDYRGIEGITRKIASLGHIPEYNDYTTVSRRVRKLGMEFDLPMEGKVDVACDGSGMKMTNSGEYKQDMYGKERRKWIRVKIAADPRTKRLLACDVCVDGEGPSEPETAKGQMEDILSAGTEILKLWGDGSYYVRDLYNFCQKHGIETAINVRADASPKAYGSMRKAREVQEYQAKGYKLWARDKEYGLRWVGTEGIFSAVKRKFGENNRSRKMENIFHESVGKFWAYQRMKDYARTRIGA